MVKTFDNEVKSTRKYAKALMAIAVVFALLVGSFVVYSCVYFNKRNELEKNYAKQLEENGCYKNTRGCYSVDYMEGVVYDIPKQSIPRLLDFSLHLDESKTSIYCNVEHEDRNVEIMWQGNNDFVASAISKTDKNVLGSTSKFTESDFMDMKKLGNELGISEQEISKIIEKGNELYKDFYSK